MSPFEFIVSSFYKSRLKSSSIYREIHKDFYSKKENKKKIYKNHIDDDENDNFPRRKAGEGEGWNLLSSVRWWLILRTAKECENINFPWFPLPNSSLVIIIVIAGCHEKIIPVNKVIECDIVNSSNGSILCVCSSALQC